MIKFKKELLITELNIRRIAPSLSGYGNHIKIRANICMIKFNKVVTLKV
jgi:hypothetical protein